ncbi:MAG: DUF3473 domain-containing protein [Burkholderiaceae bacterium]|nr:DUF3473 domain-containing protein [Burkholderiaceae bacterium]
MINAFSIDVEDWFQVSAFAPHIERSRWDALPCRVERNVDLLLGLLQESGCAATFFTLGWIAERYPAMVRRIVAAGHELASHGYAHLRASEQEREEFRADLVRAKAILEGISGAPVLGYRAPSFSIGPRNAWAHDLIAETGHVYSSSVYPVAHDHYGTPDAPRFAHRLDTGLVEIPPSTVRWGGRNWPIGGGGYFRLLPYRVSAWGIRRVNAVDARPAMVYFHPWEFDPGQPRVRDAGAKARFRHYLNLGRTEARIRRLLREFSWDRVDRAFAGEIASGAGAPGPASSQEDIAHADSRGVAA